jgi:hypothetical protein
MASPTHVVVWQRFVGLGQITYSKHVWSEDQAVRLAIRKDGWIFALDHELFFDSNLRDAPLQLRNPPRGKNPLPPPDLDVRTTP